VDEGNGADIEVEVETATKVMVNGIKGDVENMSGCWTGIRS